MGSDEARRADIDAIIQVKYLYGAMADGTKSGEYSGEDLDKVFTDDAEVQFAQAPRIVGLAALKTYFGETQPARIQFTWHSFSNPMIEVDGDRASGRWLMLAFAQVKGAATQSMNIGTYKERYVRTPQGWRISEMVFTRQN